MGAPRVSLALLLAALLPTALALRYNLDWLTSVGPGCELARLSHPDPALANMSAFWGCGFEIHEGSMHAGAEVGVDGFALWSNGRGAWDPTAFEIQT